MFWSGISVKVYRVNFFKTRYLLLSAAASAFPAALPAADIQVPQRAEDVDFAAVKAAEAAKERAELEKIEAAKKAKREEFEKAEAARRADLASKLSAQQKKSEGKYRSSYLSSLSGATPQLEAKSPLDYDTETGKFVAKTNARLTDKNFEVEADVIEFYSKDGRAKAAGDVRMSQEKVRVLARSVELSSSENTMKAAYVRLGSNPLFIETDGVSGDKRMISAGKSSIYFGEPDFASMNVGVGGISYDSDEDYLELEDALFKIGPVPFMYVPYYGQYGLERPPFIFENRVGYNSDFGFRIQNTVLYTGLGPVAPGVLLDGYTKRGVLFGPAADYDYSSDWFRAVGELRSGYISDQGSDGVLGVNSFGAPIPRDRFFIDWKNRASISERIGVTSLLNYWSDEFVTRDFRESIFDRDQVPDNFAEASYRGDFYSFSAFARFLPNSWESAVQRLPEATFNMPSRAVLNTGIYQNFFATYGYYRDSSPQGLRDTLSFDRFDAYYGLSRPVKLNSWSSITPILGGRLTYYGSTADNSGSYVRMLGQAGFDAQADAWGLWEVRSQTLGIDGVRHNIRPVVKYRYIPSADQGKSRIKQVDTLYYGSYPSVFDLGLMRNVDDLYSANTMRVGLENVFQTRDGSYGSREIARIDLYQDFNFERQPYISNPGRRYSFSDFYANVSVSPARWLTIGAYNRLNVNNSVEAEINGYLRISDGDEWRLELGNYYLASEISQYYLLAQYRISENYMLMGRWHYDARLSKMTDQAYILWTRLGNSWIIEYQISFRSGSTRENDLSFGARLNFATF